MPLSSTPEIPTRAESARPRRRLAALSVVGALVLALPLVQVLRYKAEELSAVRRERAGLDPMAHAVEVQRHLIVHRDLSGQVLQGQAALEPRRAQQQGRVDGAVVLLAGDFSSGLWPRARSESDALRSDWSVLKSDIVAHRIAFGRSDLAHQLLIEHCLQITDELADGLAVHAGLSTETAMLLRQVVALPREIGRSPRGAPPTQQMRAATDLQLQRFSRLHAAAAQALAGREIALLRQRAALWAATSALAVTALGLVLQLLRRRPAPIRPSPPHALRAVLRQRPASPPDGPAQSVLQRVREGGIARGVREAQDTLPPI